MVMQKRIVEKGVVFIAIIVTFCCSLAAADFDDIPQIRSSVVSNGALFAISEEGVFSKFTILNVKTNGTLLEVTAKDVCGVGTNGVFSYSLRNHASVVRVECRDASDSGADYFFSDGGSVLNYAEYKEGKLHGVYMRFFTNSFVKVFMNMSNHCFVGKSYEFDMSGNVMNITTANVPISLEYQIGPPQ